MSIWNRFSWAKLGPTRNNIPYDKEIQSLLLDIEEEKEEQAAEEKAEDEAIFLAILQDGYFEDRASSSKEDMGNEWEEEVTKQSYWDDTFYDPGN